MQWPVTGWRLGHCPLADTSLLLPALLSLAILVPPLQPGQAPPRAPPWPTAPVHSGPGEVNSVHSEGASDGRHARDSRPCNSSERRPCHAQSDAVLPLAASGGNTRPATNLSSLQCLPSLQADAAACAADICGRTAGWDRVRFALRLSPPSVFASQCWPTVHSSDCLPPVLTQDELKAIHSSDESTCVREVARLLTRIQRSNQRMEDSLAVLLSGHRELDTMDCHNTTHCQTCMDWYRTWLCLQEWPVYSGTGERVAACREECRAVQQHCPFLAIHEDASMASGDPSFLCQDSSIVFPIGQTHEQCCYQTKPHTSAQCSKKRDTSEAAAPPPVLDPGPGNWTDLNQTNCCMLHGGGGGGGLEGGGGDKAQFCDSLALAGHRTLIVRRRTPADVSVLEQTESSGTGGGCQLKFDIDNITNCLRSASGSSAASSTVLAHTTIFILRAVCS